MVARSVQPWRGSPASGTANEVRAITSAVTSAVSVAIAITIAIAIAIIIARAGVVAATVIAVAAVVATAVVAVPVPVITVTVPIITIAAITVAAVATAAAGTTVSAVAVSAAAVAVSAAAFAVSAAAAVVAIARTTDRRRLCIPQGRCHVHREGSSPVQGGLRSANPENGGDRCDDNKIHSGRAILILLEFLEKSACACRSLGLGAPRQKLFVPELIKQGIIPFKRARHTQTARHTAFQFVR